MTNHLDPDPAPSPYFYPNLEATRLQLLSQKLNGFCSELRAYPEVFDEHMRPIAELRSEIQAAATKLDTMLEDLRRNYLNARGHDL